MVSVYGHQKSEKVRKKIYRLLRLMRRSKKIEFDDITDNSHTEIIADGYAGPLDFFGMVEREARAYQLGLSVNQPCVVEVLCEGQGKVVQLFQLARHYGVPVRSPGGWDSIAPKRELALRAARVWEQTGRQTRVLHLGDFDPDGVGLFEVLREDSHAFLEAHILDDPKDVLKFKRIMTHRGQIPQGREATFDRYEVKEKDHRGKRWPYEFTAQLESVPLEETLAIVRAEIEELLDLDQLREDREQSEVQRDEVLDLTLPLIEDAAERLGDR